MNNKYFVYLLILGFFTFFTTQSQAQRNKKKAETSEIKKEKHFLDTVGVSGLKFRSVGPAITSGRISDFAIHPENEKIWYVATSSGGVWKTSNAGTTFKPIFDSQGSYSIGCVTMDPNNPNVIWVGTGENNNQRSVAYGDGVYKSLDGGRSWKHMGLKQSEHIAKVIVDPRNSDVVYVAAIGPLWSSGGDRGVYKSIDGGKNWEAVLTVSEHTGATDLIMDPRDPDVMYAAMMQRRRHVFTYLGGGPESGLYKTTDGGANWHKANKGLPKVDLGRIGLAISPADPEILYAIVEAGQGKSGFYRSTNRGASWDKRGSHSTSGNYYQEIVACPHDPDRIFSMDTWLSVSEDGGKTFKRTGENTKHVDNHCMWIDPEDPDHWLLGCDGGIYDTWDGAATWGYYANLPVTQFYKVAVDNSEPFYYIYGGTQDNFSMGGPSRTVSDNGIANSDWFMTHGGDGFETQIDPYNPNIVYAQSQYGVLVRYDRLSGEELGIQPQPRKGENTYRWNWDAPLAVSVHREGRLYFAANKLFRSDDRGNSWDVLGDDLTAQIDRNKLKVMGRIWGIDAVNKHRSTSPFGTIVAFSESPLNEDILYVGTDDGLIQVSENGGESWRRVEGIPGVPDMTYVNALYASMHEEGVVYACFNHHKYGDFTPYVFRSADKGQTWTSISSNLPERGSSYAIAEDHEDAGLLFVGTEFGVFFTNDQGGHWKRLKAGVPTIAVRDIAIQERENDLVLGTFGRGFYVLDDYSSLRGLKADQLAGKEAHLFDIRPALMFEKSYPLGLPGKSFQGDNYYLGENLGPVAMITYYVRDKIMTLEQKRRKAEKDMEDVYNPDYETYKAEREQSKPEFVFTISDENGQVVRKLVKKPEKGLQRIQWDLRYASTNPVRLSRSSFYNPFASSGKGNLVAPGTYTVSLEKNENGVLSSLCEPRSFEVIALDNTVLPALDREGKVAFQRDVNELNRVLSGAQRMLNEVSDQLRHVKKAIELAEVPSAELMEDYLAMEKEYREIRQAISGDPVARSLGMDIPETLSSRMGTLRYEQSSSTGPPTSTHREVYRIAKEELEPLVEQIRQLATVKMKALQMKLEKVKAPYTPGRQIRMGDQ